jgi:hypothetical protein
MNSTAKLANSGESLGLLERASDERRAKQSTPTQQTVGSYLAAPLSQIGLKHHFAVPATALPVQQQRRNSDAIGGKADIGRRRPAR